MLLASCGPAAHDWTGEWTGELPSLSPDAPKDTVANTLNKVKLTVRPDGTFTLVRGGIPADGETIPSDGGLILRFRKVLGQPLDKQPQEVRQQYADAKMQIKEGSVVLVDPTDFNRDPVKLLRAKPTGG